MSIFNCCFSASAVVHPKNEPRPKDNLDQKVENILKSCLKSSAKKNFSAVKVNFNPHSSLRFIDLSGKFFHANVNLKNPLRNFTEVSKLFPERQVFSNLSINDLIDFLNQELLSRAQSILNESNVKDLFPYVSRLSTGILMDLLNDPDPILNAQDLKEKWLKKVEAEKIESRLANIMNKVLDVQCLEEMSVEDENLNKTVENLTRDEDHLELKMLWDIPSAGISKVHTFGDLRKEIRKFLEGDLSQARVLWSEMEKEIKVLVLIDGLFEPSDLLNRLNDWISSNKTHSSNEAHVMEL